MAWSRSLPALLCSTAMRPGIEEVDPSVGWVESLSAATSKKPTFFSDTPKMAKKSFQKSCRSAASLVALAHLFENAMAWSRMVCLDISMWSGRAAMVHSLH